MSTADSAGDTTAELAQAPLRRGRGRWARFRRHKLALLGVGILLVFGIGSVFAPWIGVHDPNSIDLDNVKAAPTLNHIMGTDAAGRDVFSRMLYGSRITLGIAGFALLIAVGVGTAIGIVSGYIGGWVDNVLMRFTELVMTFPTLFALIILVSIVGGSVVTITVVIGLLGWTGIARLIRAQVLSVKEMEFVLAARASGADDLRIALVHVLPEVMPYMAVAGTLGLASAILVEAALNFLGLGVQIPTPTWGNMMTAAQSLHVIKNLPLALGPSRHSHLADGACGKLHRRRDARRSRPTHQDRVIGA